MADYLNIAGRIRTTASDGVAMEAHEVKDLNLNKSQQEVNADVQTELGDRYTKEETYSKEQLNELITTPDVNRVYVIATNLTTAVTDLLPATGSSDTLYNVGNWDGTQYDTTVYSIYGWDGTAYVCLAVRSFIGEVYDISANHPDGQGNPTPYADLTAALGTDGANVPAGIRRGGMSIKFIQGTVQSSDNNYIQFRCIADDFTTDTKYWVICDENVFTENPEWIKVVTDKNDRIIYGIKKDGGFYFGAGCPQQVKDYVQSKIDEYHGDDILSFLNELEEGDKTLQQLLNEKVTKVEGESLINENYANSISYQENDRFVKIETDANDKVISVVQKDGTKIQYVPVEMPKAKVGGVDIYPIDSPEWSGVILDKEGRVVAGIQKDGKGILNGDALINGLLEVGGLKFKNGLPKQITDALKENHKKDDAFNVGINVFGDILPSSFKSKLLSLENDILIACVGDSLTGAVQETGLVDDPSHAAPGHQYNDWVTKVLGFVNKNKPQNDRLDSKRDGSDVFTKVGTWNETDYNTFAPSTDFGDSSYASITFRSADSDAQVEFSWDLDEYDKCNIVVTKSIDAVLSKIEVGEGSGKVLVSVDRTTWEEANGFTFNQRTNTTGMTDAELKTAGEAKYERHRRLWMKKANGATGIVTITYKRDNTTSYSDSYLYCWGIERYSFPAVFFDNIGRGGKTTKVLSYNTSDIFDRKPDLVLYEMPVANEQGKTYTTAQSEYNDYFLSDNAYSFKTKSNNYQDVPVVIFIPHCRNAWFNADNSVVYNSSQDMPRYYFAKKLYAYLKSGLSDYNEVSSFNLLDYILDEAVNNFGSINKGLNGTSMYGYTVDGTHLSKYGADKYAKYIAPLFYL